MLALACGLAAVPVAGCDSPNRAKAPGYAGDERTSGGDAQDLPDNTDLDDDALVRGLFFELGDAERIRTCAPAGAPWVIIAYAPEVLDAHSVRTREVHCSERAITERCQLVSHVGYYLEDPEEYFTIASGVAKERALEIAALADAGGAVDGRLLAVGADRGVDLITYGECGSETQVAVKVSGDGKQRSLKVIETRYKVEL